MTSLADIRQKYPQYNSLSDQQLADALYKKFYSALPRDQFDQKIGLSNVAQPPPNLTPGSREYADWAAAQARAGKTLPQVSPPPPPLGTQPDPLSRFANNAATGTIAAIQGATGSVPFLNQASDALIAGGQTLGDILTKGQGDFGQHYGQLEANRHNLASEAPLASAAGGIAGTIGLAGGVSALPAGAEALGMTGSFGKQLLNSALSTAGYEGAQGIANGDLGKTGDFGIPKVLEDMGIGGATGAAGSAVGQGFSRLISPHDIPADRQAAIDALQNAGVDLTAGQRTGSKSLQYAESELGGGTTANLMDRQGQQFTSAALAKAGINADRATPDVIDQGFKDIGGQMDAVAKANPMPFDGQLSTELADAVKTYNSSVNPTQRAPIINETLQDLVNAYKQNGGQLSGDAYQALRSRLERVARGTKDPDLASALRDIKNAMDNAVERGMAATGSPDLGTWRQLRDQYRNLLVVTNAAAANGEKAASGIITPAQLATSTKSVFGKRAYARGTDNYSDLARAGQTIMSPLPNSGTAQRLGAKSLAALPAVIGGAIGTPAGLPGIAGGAIMGAAAPWLMGKTLMSGPVQGYLGNTLASQLGRDTISAPISLGARALASALMRLP